jgi:hypothetical protein
MVLDLWKARMRHAFQTSKRLGNVTLKFVERRQHLETTIGSLRGRMKEAAQKGVVEGEKEAVKKYLENVLEMLKATIGEEENISVIYSRIDDEIEEEAKKDRTVEELLAKTPYAKDDIIKKKVLKLHKLLEDISKEAKVNAANIASLAQQAKWGIEGLSARLAKLKIGEDMQERLAARKVRFDSKKQKAIDEKLMREIADLRPTILKKTNMSQKLNRQLDKGIKVAEESKENLLDMFAALYKLYLFAVSHEFEELRELKWMNGHLSWLKSQGFPQKVEEELNQMYADAIKYTKTQRRVQRKETRTVLKGTKKAAVGKQRIW